MIYIQDLKTGDKIMDNGHVRTVRYVTMLGRNRHTDVYRVGTDNGHVLDFWAGEKVQTP